MTDLPEPGRPDLRVLVGPPDRDQADRVIQAALARANVTPRVLPWIAGRSRPILAAAALLAVVAYGLLRFAPRAEPLPEPASALAEWIAADHVPTNGEILTAFQGYVP